MARSGRAGERASEAALLAVFGCTGRAVTPRGEGGKDIFPAVRRAQARISKQARRRTSSAAVCRPQRRRTTKAHDEMCVRALQRATRGLSGGFWVQRAAAAGTGVGGRKTFRAVSQSRLGRRSEPASGDGGGLRQATGCDPSALTRRALEAGSFWQRWGLAAGQLPRAGQRCPQCPRCAPPVGRAWGSYGLRRRCCQDGIDCLIAHLSADGQTRNPRPDMACNKSSAGADDGLPTWQTDHLSTQVPT